MMKVGFVGWRGMVGSVLMQRMQEERDFARIEPHFFTTSNVGGQGPAVGRDLAPLADAMSVEALKDLGVGESWQVLAHGIIQPNLFLFYELHNANRRNCFGHGGNSNDRIDSHRLAIRHVPNACCALVDNFVARCCNADNTGNFPILDGGFECICNCRGIACEIAARLPGATRKFD